MQKACCELGEKFFDKKNVLYESDNFFLAPAVGQMGIEGYLLLCSKAHFFGICDTPSKYYPELENILDKAKGILSKAYNSEVFVFEHGPKSACHKGGACLDHAHLHLVPLSTGVVKDVRKFLNKNFKFLNIRDFNELSRIYHKQKYSYMFIETANKKRYIIKSDLPIPSQYLRQVIASNIGSAEWDWRINPDCETFKNTMKYLRNKFGGVA